MGEGSKDQCRLAYSTTIADDDDDDETVGCFMLLFRSRSTYRLLASSTNIDIRNLGVHVYDSSSFITFGDIIPIAALLVVNGKRQNSDFWVGGRILIDRL